VNFPSPVSPAGANVLSIRPFRRLWIATSLSSLGDWLSLVALSTLAVELAGHGAAAQGAAVSGVWLTSLLPALLLGPLAGAVADTLDRRLNMIVGDTLRAGLYLTLVLNLTFGIVNRLTWMYIVQFLASCASLFWTPAKDASVPNLVPPDKLEQANQYGLLGTFGPAPVAGIFFALLALISKGLASISPYFTTNRVNLALYFNAATFVVSAVTIYLLREIPKRQHSEHISVPSVAKTIWDGWRYLGRNQVVRGLIIGIVGAFTAGGVVVGLGPSYITTSLNGGSAGWGLVFAAVFGGLAAGMFLGLRILSGFSRRRLFGLAIVGAGVPLILIGLIPSLVPVVLLVILLGAFAGIAYVTGYTIVGREVDDDTRGRTFAFLQSGIRVILFAVIAIAPGLAAGFTALVHAITGSSTLQIGTVDYDAIGYNLVLLLSAAIAIWLGLVAYRQMDDRRGVPLRDDLYAAFRGSRFKPVPAHPNGRVPPPPGQPGRRGLLLAFEGGEGAGKTTQARLLAIWLREQGFDVVATHEPGATKMGMRLRALLLDTAHAGLSPRAETLMYAADRAEHVAAVIAPALDRGAIVVTDRFTDSSIAYQGRGRNQETTQVAGLNRWATGGLQPDLTILLDLPPAEGLSRRAPAADRLEAEPADFHQRVREGFLAQAAAEPDRYLVLDATRPPDQLSREVQERVRDLLPDPVPPAAEDNTGGFPAIGE
jgi:dTMP kinase